jgi:hypothetical protein
MIRLSSLMAYHDMLDAGIIARQEYKIIEWLYWQKKPVSRNEIERATGIRINAISGRINRMVQDGIVREELETSTCPISGRKVHKVTMQEKDNG